MGAAAVQVGTASFSDPKASEGIVDGLARLVYEVNMSNINELTGKFLAENG
jgi:dihydroorotate dehydrogenase